MDYPIRLNHYLALRGYTSRRMADKLIEDGKVRVNGRRAVIGQKISETDAVEMDLPTRKKIENDRIYLVYNKPKGIDSHDPKLTMGKGLFPIGRLDKNSRGLLILTNDGRVTDRMLNPRHEHEKEYLVTVDKKLRPGFLEKMRTGITIDDYTTRPAKTNKQGESKFKIILTEGRHHQIRRMCDVFAYTVRDLKRERIMNIRLAGLKEGQSRKLGGKELAEFLTALELK